ncbi:countin-1-like [Physella acuta]|uniref:countin-1-like n=1 Tax=Physella acuta TaxID=109671 RepID=UPI0027DE1B18|nr:countin-1-like [Physella acuta]
MNYIQVLSTLLSAVVLTSGLSPIGQKNYRGLRVLGVQPVGVDWCKTCIDFSGQAINELLNIILNMGVIGTCADLCNVLAEKTGSQILGAVCNILCDVEGVKEFVNLIEKADLDPIYLCELLKSCPVFDGGDATITGFTVVPSSGPQGKKTINLQYTSRNGTGTGELYLFVQTVDQIPVEGSFLQEPQQPGNYAPVIDLDAEPDPDCDPTQDFCEEWLPGTYTATVQLCNGECGSKHPHSKIYDQKSTTFVITQ